MKRLMSGIIAFILVLALPPPVFADYTAESFLRFKADGPVNLAPYLDFSRVYLKVIDTHDLDAILEKKSLKLERLMNSEGTEFLAQFLRPEEGPKEYLSALNTLGQDINIIFASPVFSFYEAKELPFKSLMSVKNTIFVHLKPGFSLDDFKKAALKVGLKEETISVLEGGLISIALSKEISYDPFRIAAFFSPYFDPRIADSSVSWTRLEPVAQATVRIYPQGAEKSAAGFISLQPVFVEIKVKTLPDVEFKFSEIGPQTSILREWQPENLQSKIFEFFDAEPEMDKKESDKNTIWTIKYRGQFLQYGNFSFPPLAVPVHPYTESGATVLSSITTNPLNAYVSELSGPNAMDLTPIGLNELPAETQWRIRLFKAGLLMFFTFLILTLLIAKPLLIGFFEKKETKREPTLAERLETALTPFIELDNRFLANPDLVSDTTLRTQWFERANRALDCFAPHVHLKRLGSIRKSIEVIQFSGGWDASRCGRILVEFQNLILEIRKRETES